MKTTDKAALLRTLEERFTKHPERHRGLAWESVAARLDAPKLQVLFELEKTGGAPDVVAWDKKSGALTFTDCSPESPEGRRSLCYDAEALKARKENKPKGSALAVAASMGVELLTEAEYRALQELGEFDLKTSSWVKTPADIRVRGGALFCDRRYGRVFAYHNGAESYYAARAFRGRLTV